MHPAFAQGYCEVMTKVANITEEDIAAALAGQKHREISPEEIQAYATQRQQGALEGAKHRPAVGTGVGAGLGALAGAALGKKMPGGRLAGAGIGALAGGGAGLGLGALSKSLAGKRGRRWGETLGEIAQEGQVPRHMPHRSHEDLVPMARGIQEETAKPLTPEEYSMIRSGLMREMMTEQGLEGALTGAQMAGWDKSEEDDTLQSQLAGAAMGGARGTLQGMQDARQRANLLSDLYERGYGHLAGRLYESD